MKIAIIGPVPPFRSGVAKHTGELAKTLAAHADVKTISFSRQYPGLLFPGKDDRDRKTRRDAPEGTEYTLDSISPLTWRRVAADLADWKPDLAVLPAWTFFTAPALTYISNGLRKAGTPVVSIVHNAADHEGAGWKRALLSRQILASTSAVTHNRGLAEAIAAFAPDLPVAVSPHPLFDFPEPEGLLKRRARLELLMFGLIRPYKGADLLIDAMGELAGEDVCASIVGEVWGDGAALTRQIAASPAADQIELVPEFQSDAYAAEYFDRADIVVLPYRHVTGSGVVPVAMRYARPVIASDLPGFREIVTLGETGWLVRPEDPAHLAKMIRERLERGDAGTLRPGIAKARQTLTWPRFAEAVLTSSTASPASDYISETGTQTAAKA